MKYRVSESWNSHSRRRKQVLQLPFVHIDVYDASMGLQMLLDGGSHMTGAQALTVA